MSLNKAILIGNVGKEPEIRRTESNTIANLTLATTEKWTDRSGNKQEKTEWHSVVVFGKGAEFVEKYISKGTQVCVEGKIRYESYDKDGEKKYVTRIYSDSIQTLGGKKEEAKEEAGRPAPAARLEQQPAPQAAPQEEGFEGNGEDDLPF